MNVLKNFKLITISNYSISTIRQYSIKPSIALISKIRQKTEVSITKAKEALIASNNNFEEALKWLETDLIKSGLKKEAKLAGRVAAEGLIGVAIAEDKASLVELCCETDFVTRSPMFHQLLSNMSQAALNLPITDKSVKIASLPDNLLKEHKAEGSEIIIKDQLSETIAKLGENIQLRRILLSNPNKNEKELIFVEGHAHNGEGLNGKIGGFVSLKVNGHLETITKEKLSKFTKQLARHVVGLNPQYLSETEPSFIIKKQELSEDELTNFTSENVLMKQEFLFGGGKVEEKIQSLENEYNIKIQIDSFARLVAGEGVEKGPEADFRDEVMKQVEKFQ